MKIENKVEKMGYVEWKKVEWFQGDLKNITKESFAKLKESIKANDFCSPFFVTVLDNKEYILDGHHRKKALEELQNDGYEIQDKLPAVYIKCSGKHEAGKVLLAINSHYAKITDIGLHDFVNEFDIDFDTLKDFELPDVSFDDMNLGDEEDITEQKDEEEKKICESCGQKINS